MRVLLTLCMLLSMGQAAFANPFQGTRARVMRAYNAAVQNDYTFLRTKQQVDEFVRSGLLVQVKENWHVKLSGVSYPFARPPVALFVNRMGAQYYEACGERLVVTSSVRTTKNQPQNASRFSVHPTGMAIDLRVPRSRKCRSWLEGNLLLLQERKVALVTRERRPPHFHVVLFPQKYIKYLKRRGVKVG